MRIEQKPLPTTAEAGFSLFLAIVMVGVLLLISFAYLQHATSRESLYLHRRAALHAQYAAEEALARYGVPDLISRSLTALENAQGGDISPRIAQLETFRPDYDFLDDGVVEFNYGFRNLNLKKEYINPQVSSEAAFYAMVDGVVTYFDPYQREDIVVERRAAASYELQNFANFMYFTDQEVNPSDDPGGEIEINFYGADIIYGRLHSNDYIKINGVAGYPQFWGWVTTAKEDVVWLNGTNPNYDIFHAGFTPNYPPNSDGQGILYPPEDAILAMRQNAGLPIFSTPAMIDSLASWQEIATTIRIRNNQLRIEQWLYNHFYPNGDTIFYTDRYTHGQYLSLPSPQRGTVSLNGKLFVEGHLQGQVTFLSSDTIWIVDDVYYNDVAFDGVNWIGNPVEDDKGMPPAGSNNRCGIVSEKNVIIAFTAENGGYNGGQNLPGCDAVEGVDDRQHILITAALMAMDNVVEVDFWHNSCIIGGDNPYGLPTTNPCQTGTNDQRGNIYLWGAVVQQRRGFVRRSPIGPYGPRIIGYDKRYHYDDNFLEFPPPNFPNTSSASGQLLFETSRVIFEKDAWEELRSEFSLPQL
ncbi:MAG: hypothetical protein ISR91_05945 [Candidatus Delongbacteria bacterium]|nr:hypothetical protein [Candidatus Delongbacteria bacterium]